MRLTSIAKRWGACALIGSLALTPASPALAQWSLLDDFDSSVLGPLGTQGGWTTALNDGAPDPYTISADPVVGTNQALSVSGDSSDATGANAYIPLGAGIPDGTTGTVFFRTNNFTGGDLVFGSSDVAAPGAWGDYEGYMRMSAGSADIRDNGGFAAGDSYNDGEWVNVWLVLDNAADTTSIYTSRGTADGTFGVTGGFRNGTTDPLSTLNLRMGGNQQNGIGYIDDVYVDLTGANTTLPAVDSTPILGDVNGDRAVTIDDYFIIRDNFRLGLTERTDGDLVNNDVIDFADFAEWKNNAPAAAVALALSGGPVPEPATWLLSLAAFFGLLPRRRAKAATR